jgi:hypothetical protein
MHGLPRFALCSLRPAERSGERISLGELCRRSLLAYGSASALLVILLITPAPGSQPASWQAIGRAINLSAFTALMFLGHVALGLWLGKRARDRRALGYLLIATSPWIVLPALFLASILLAACEGDTMSYDYRLLRSALTGAGVGLSSVLAGLLAFARARTRA